MSQRCWSRNIRKESRLKIDLHPVPPLVCRPQQLSAVFSNLMGNAIEATNGNGRVVVSSRQREENSR